MTGEGSPARSGTQHRPADAGRRPVPDDARQLGDERLDRDGGQGRRHDGDRDPGRDHGLHAGDGGADDHRRQDRRDDRPQARLRDRLRDLRRRVVDDLARAEPAGAALRLVVPRRRRRGADPAGDRRARGRELPRRAPPGRLRARRGGRRDRRGRRPADRRLLPRRTSPGAGSSRRGRGRARDPPARRAGSPTRPSRRGRSSTWSARSSRRSGSRCSSSGSSAPASGAGSSRTPDGPSWAGLSPTVWLVLGGLFVVYLFFNWENRREAAGRSRWSALRC